MALHFKGNEKNSNESGFTFPLKADTCVVKKKKLLRKKFFRINLGEIRHQFISMISFYLRGMCTLRYLLGYCVISEISRKINNIDHYTFKVKMLPCKQRCLMKNALCT